MKHFEPTTGARVSAVAAIALAAASLAVVIMLSGCTVSKPSAFVAASVEGGNVVIPKTQISNQAAFVNYDANGTNVQLIAVESTDGKPHVALNTCQSCNPSPKAYFEQNGDTLTCNNCGLKFSVDTVGATGASSCNPAPVIDLTETDEAFAVPASTLDRYAPFFENWQGPTK